MEKRGKDVKEKEKGWRREGRMESRWRREAMDGEGAKEAGEGDEAKK